MPTSTAPIDPDVRRVALHSAGCKLNAHEGEAIASGLRARGFELVAWEGVADYYVLNTCTVTHRSDSGCRSLVRQARRRAPDSRVIVTGCYAQTAAEELAAMPEIDLVVGNLEKGRIPAFVERMELDGLKDRVLVSDVFGERTLDVPLLSDFETRTRPFLKIQDGCQKFCSFCIIPYARGRSRSVPPDRLVEQVELLARAGHHEVVLSGIHIVDYGHDLEPPTTLEALIRRLADLPGAPRIRLGSLDPVGVGPGLVDALALGPDAVCRHLHVSVQSGEDSVLERMRRRYGSELLRDVVGALADRIPDVGLGADVIVGFPGETDASFASTVSLLDELPFSYLHVFAYSARRGTPAARMDGAVPAATIKRRSAELRALGRSKRRAYVAGQLGRELTGVVVQPSRGAIGCVEVLTDNYLKIDVPAEDAGRGDLVSVVPESLREEGIRGRRVDTIARGPGEVARLSTTGAHR